MFLGLAQYFTAFCSLLGPIQDIFVVYCHGTGELVLGADFGGGKAQSLLREAHLGKCWWFHFVVPLRNVRNLG